MLHDSRTAQAADSVVDGACTDSAPGLSGDVGESLRHEGQDLHGERHDQQGQGDASHAQHDFRHAGLIADDGAVEEAALDNNLAGEDLQGVGLRRDDDDVNLCQSAD